MGYVYIIRAEGTNRYKIGITDGKPSDRLKQLSTASPFPLALYEQFDFGPYSMQVEKYLHHIFSDYRKHGEWFSLDLGPATDLLTLVQGLLQEYEKEKLLGIIDVLVNTSFESLSPAAAFVDSLRACMSDYEDFQAVETLKESII